MSDRQPVQEVLDLLRSELRSEPGAKGQANVIRTFLEIVREAMKDLLTHDKPEQIQEWAAKMQVEAQRVGRTLNFNPGKYADLNALFPMGNIKGHNNIEAILIDTPRCIDALKRIERDIPLLVADMHSLGQDLVAQIWRRQSMDLNRRRAQLLSDAVILHYGAVAQGLETIVWPKVEQVLDGLVEPRMVHGLRKNPKIEARVERAITKAVVEGATAEHNCALVRLARSLSGPHPIQEWLESDAQMQALLKSKRPLHPVLRIELRAPEGVSPFDTTKDEAMLRAMDELFREGAWEIRGPHDYWDESGAHTTVCENAAVSATSPATLARAVLDGLHESFRDLERRGRNPTGKRPADAVLWLAVGIDFVHYDWEGLVVERSPVRRFPLSEMALAVVVEASDPFDFRTEGPDPVTFEDTVIYDSADDDRWHANQGARLAVALQAAWEDAHHCGATCLAMATGMQNRAAVIQLPTQDPDGALSVLHLGPDSPPRHWSEMIQTMGNLKRDGHLRTPGACRIICLDNRYEPPAAAS